MTSDVNGKNQDTLFGYVADNGTMRGRRKDEGWASLVEVLDEPAWHSSTSLARPAAGNPTP
jgi:hypothetical protein